MAGENKSTCGSALLCSPSALTDSPTLDTEGLRRPVTHDCGPGHAHVVTSPAELLTRCAQVGGTPRVLSAGHGFKVLGVDAVLHSAQMVQHESLRDRPHQ